jgi:hypothetical protein
LTLSLTVEATSGRFSASSEILLPAAGNVLEALTTGTGASTELDLATGLPVNFGEGWLMLMVRTCRLRN